MTEPSKTAAGAIWSLVLGILGLTCMGPLGAIPAIICGHVAFSRIRRSQGALAGDGLAIAGFTLGYVGLFVMLPLMAGLLLPAVTRARDRAQTVQCLVNLRQIDAAKTQAVVEGHIPDGQAINASQLDPYLAGGFASLRCPREGVYTIEPAGEPPQCSVHGTAQDPRWRR